MSMNPEVKKEWLHALRSGEYEQGKGRLQSTDGEFCCLGVLCDLAVKARVIEAPITDWAGDILYGEDDHFGTLPYEVSGWSGVSSLGYRPDRQRPPLIDLNDSGTPFHQIADVIEAEF